MLQRERESVGRACKSEKEREWKWNGERERENRLEGSVRKFRSSEPFMRKARENRDSEAHAHEAFWSFSFASWCSGPFIPLFTLWKKSLSHLSRKLRLVNTGSAQSDTRHQQSPHGHKMASPPFPSPQLKPTDPKISRGENQKASHPQLPPPLFCVPALQKIPEISLTRLGLKQALWYPCVSFHLCERFPSL